MNHSELAKYIIIAGIVIVVIGLGIYFIGDKLSWFGRLPGDIRIEKSNFKFYFPVTSLILITVVLNLIVWMVRKLL